jgi:hypothetical protein
VRLILVRPHSKESQRFERMAITALSPATARVREAAILLPPGFREDAIVPSWRS